MSSDNGLIYFKKQKESSVSNKGSSVSNKESSVSNKDNLINFPFSTQIKSLTNKFPLKKTFPLKNTENKTEDKNKSEDKLKDTSTATKNYYSFAVVACVLCLMILGIPYLQSQNNGNGIPEQYITIPRRGIADIAKQQKKILHLLKTNQRKIASIGHKPSEQDIFASTLLQSHYQVEWDQGKLIYAVLLDTHEPIHTTSGDKIINQYKSIFPNYINIEKEHSMTNNLEIYKLHNKDGFNQAQVELLKDTNNKLLSIHVFQ